MADKVSVIRCESYSDCRAAIDEALSYIGGMSAYVKKGDRVLIKPNYVAKRRPGDAATTHPAFLHAVIRSAEEAGGIVTVAESPGGAYNAAALRSVYKECGAYEAIEGTNAVLNTDCSFSDAQLPDGKTIRSAQIIDPVLNADVIISLPKLKTHAMTAYTGAVKNLFGVIPGTHKAEMHFRLKDREPFCSMLVDLCERVRPALSIMDGIWGMEGDGPTSGTSRHMGLVLASANPHALDLAACEMIGYTPDEVATVKEAVGRGLIPKSADGLEIMGERLRDVLIHDVVKPKSHFNLLQLLNLPPKLNSFVEGLLASRPKPDYSMCIGCGECARDCPPKAIRMVDKRPVIDKGECIRCFCCQELCPVHAMKIHRSIVNKFMVKVLK